jgi:hypothetical protein
VKKLAWALLLSSALPACTLIQPLDDAKPADDSSAGGKGNGSGGSGKNDGGSGDTTAGGAGATESGGSGDTTAGGASPSGGAPSGGSAGRAPTGGAGGVAGAGGSPQTGAYCAGPVAPCGGNLIGTWLLQSSCVILSASDPTIPATCQGATAFQSYTLTGAVTFATSSITSDTNESWMETLKYTTACITSLHADSADYPNFPASPPASAASCSMIASIFADSMTTASCPYASAGGGTCNCTLNFSANSQIQTDAYELVGTEQYVDDATDPNGDYPVSFCVKGNTLTTSQSSASGQVIQHVLTLESR